MPRRKRRPLINSKNSDDDSGEDIPLSCFENKAAREYDFNHYNTLLQYEITSCDFCDEKFNNRYNQITHNAKHIIIPLIKHELHQCLECFYYFTSHNELSSHKDLKHPIKKTKFTNRFVFEDDIISGDDDDGDASNDDNNDNDVIDNCDDNSILNYFVNDNCKVKLDHGNLKALENINNIDSTEKDATILNGYCDSSDDEKYICVDYSVLMKPGFFRCKFCGKAFANRYELLCHNIVHIKFRKSKTNLCCYCEGYYASRESLTNHVETFHNTKRVIHIHNYSCNKCGAVYHDLRMHYKVHHRRTCFKCQKDFDDEQALSTHYTQHYERATCHLCSELVPKLDLDGHIKKHNVLMRVCGFCETFSKNLSMYSYRHIQKIDASTGYSKCDQCTLDFPTLNLVEKVWKVNESVLNIVKSRKMRGGKRAITNEMRLKNIQNRMKILNKIRKF